MLLSACAAGDTREWRARTARVALHPDYGDGIRFFDERRSSEAFQRDQVLNGMEATALAVYAGDVYDAGRIGDEARRAIEYFEAPEADFFAVLGDEGLRVFRGEPHERSMLTFYLGLAKYLSGEFNDARIYFMQSMLASQTRDDDMSDFRGDFRLGSYFLGRAFLRLGDDDNARVALQNAGAPRERKEQPDELSNWRKQRERAHRDELRLEAEAFRRATTGKAPVVGVVDLSKPVARREMPVTLDGAAAASPVLRVAAEMDDFVDPEFQAAANLIVIVELGSGPYKLLEGRDGQWDVYHRVMYRERAVDVYVDGHRAGPAFKLFDGWHEASTRGVETRRVRQTAKWLAKEALRWAPYASLVAALWDVRADGRFVQLLPGEVHVFAAKVTPGVHHVSLRCFDINDWHLPRFDVERYFIPAPDEGDVVVLLHPKENESNAHLMAAREPEVNGAP